MKKNIMKSKAKISILLILSLVIFILINLSSINASAMIPGEVVNKNNIQLAYPVETTEPPNNFQGTAHIYLPILKASVKPPIITHSFYVDYPTTTIDPANLFYFMGCERGEEDFQTPGTQSTVVILDFGYPWQYNNVSGVHMLNGDYKYLSQLNSLIFSFADGYWSCTAGDNSSQLVIGVGVNNFDDGYSFNSLHGQQWGQMIHEIHDSLKTPGSCESNNGCSIGTQVSVAAAGDFELGNQYVGQQTTLDWVAGYLTTIYNPNLNAYLEPFYNFGNAAGCGLGLACDNNWSEDGVIIISSPTQACPVCKVLPEIYFPENSDQWQYLSTKKLQLYGYKMVINGVTAEEKSCEQNLGTCGSTHYPNANDSYAGLFDKLNSVPSTAENTSELQFLTDMCWIRTQTSNFCR